MQLMETARANAESVDTIALDRHVASNAHQLRRHAASIHTLKPTPPQSPNRCCVCCVCVHTVIGVSMSTASHIKAAPQTNTSSSTTIESHSRNSKKSKVTAEPTQREQRTNERTNERTNDEQRATDERTTNNFLDRKLVFNFHIEWHSTFENLYFSNTHCRLTAQQKVF